MFYPTQDIADDASAAPDPPHDHGMWLNYKLKKCNAIDIGWEVPTVTSIEHGDCLRHENLNSIYLQRPDFSRMQNLDSSLCKNSFAE